MTELWKDIRGWPGYQVSNLGRVWRAGKWIPCGPPPGKRWIAPADLPGNVLTTGYVQVMLPGRQKRTVHRLVAEAWCQGRAMHLVVNHKNGIKTDNRAENLEWVTQSANNLHSFRVLGRTNRSQPRKDGRYCAV